MTIPASPADPYPGPNPGSPRAPGSTTPGTTTAGGTATGGTTTGPATSPGGRGTAPHSTGKVIGRSLALGLLLFVTVLLVLFVVFNTQTVEISLVFGNVDAPLVLALLIAAALGALISALAGAVLRARRRGR